jgi:hypothetical protein
MTARDRLQSRLRTTSTGAAASAPLPLPGWARWIVRLAGAGLLGAMAGIHLHLYQLGYSTVSTIGPLFLLNGVVGSVAAAVVLLAPARWLPVASAGGALLQIGTLLGLVLSLTVGLFGFSETPGAPLVGWTFAVESAGFLVLAAHAGYEGRPLVASLRGRNRP